MECKAKKDEQEAQRMQNQKDINQALQGHNSEISEGRHSEKFNTQLMDNYRQDQAEQQKVLRWSDDQSNE